VTLRNGLLGLSAVLMAVTLYLALVWTKPDVNLGDTVRIFYFHVPTAWVGFLAFGVVFVASIGYLVRSSERWDAVAYSAAEIGVLFATLMLVTGSIFGKVAWGTWWTWSPRLTTSLILWLIYVAYLMLRAYAPRGGQGARYGAVLGIIGFVDVPIVYFSVNWWRDVHPERMIGPQLAIEVPMLVALIMGVATFTVLFVYMLIERYHLRRVEETVERMRFTYG
jgi:heme exporter protein C